MFLPRALERPGRQPRLERGLELAPEALAVEASEAGVPRGARVEPLRERRHVDLHLAVRERRHAVLREAVGGRVARALRLLPRPLARLVRGPGGRQRGEREEDRRDELEPAVRA